MLRLVTVKEVFLPKGVEGFPVGEAFVPTKSDKDEADARGRPVLVSVWEHGVTTADQAAAIRRADAERDGRSPGEFVPWWLKTADVEDAGTTPDRVRVLHDPRPKEDGAGAVGHAGIKGLERVSGERKTEWRAMLDRLAEKARRDPP